ncbi:hypothetical protein JY651_18875 [Pyxidicoccus parkwayensis]|uniref:Uncharacterized protein n=1 Tax=Pyxidicoccus parkwayensis TaxID=2813578 RepID=A0ABX7P8T2_9BACT|nr:hypothetical protein [Pyxidicoccus parkwaysis]QSQ26849.1 hypothetical protein JY651_18875 [Pyxidicoccus parkwaysis]
MRRCWSLALLVSFASPALAQAPATPEAAAPTPAPAAEAPAPEAPVPTPAAPAPAAPAPQRRTQAAPPPAPKPSQSAPAPSPAAPAPTPAAPGTSPSPTLMPQPYVPLEQPLPREEQIRKDIREDSRFLFQSLITGDVRSAAGELMYPFQLEEKRYGTAEELVLAWVKQLRLKRTDLITLYDIEVLPLAEMEKKYGKAPARLGLDLRNEKDVWAAVGNLSGHPGIFLYRPYRDEYRAFAYTD